MTAKPKNQKLASLRKETEDTVDTDRITQALESMLKETGKNWHALSTATGMDKSVFSRLVNKTRTAGIRTNQQMASIIDAFEGWGLDRDAVAERMLTANAIDRAPREFKNRVVLKVLQSEDAVKDAAISQVMGAIGMDNDPEFKKTIITLIALGSSKPKFRDALISLSNGMVA